LEYCPALAAAAVADCIGRSAAASTAAAVVRIAAVAVVRIAAVVAERTAAAAERIAAVAAERTAAVAVAEAPEGNTELPAVVYIVAAAVAERIGCSAAA